MKNIEVKNCMDCPFSTTEYSSDDFDYGNVTERCNLINFKNKEGYKDSFISSHSMNDIETEECEYCIEYWNDFHESIAKKETEPIFIDENCKCEKIRQKYIDSLPKIEFKSPEWCPLEYLKEINIKLIKNE